MARTASSTSRSRQITTGVGAVAVVALIGALPVLLLWAAGNPLPGIGRWLARLGDDPGATLTAVWQGLSSRDDGDLFLHVLTAVGWVAAILAAWAWLSFLGAFAVEFVTQLRAHRHGRIPRAAKTLPGMRVQQRAAAVLAATIIGALGAPTLASASTSMPPTLGQPAAAAVHHIGAAADTAAATTHTSSSRSATVVEVPVQRGESLLDIAERHGIAPQRLAEANYGLTQPDGRSLQPGSMRVYAGWTLRVPVTTQPVAATMLLAGHTSVTAPRPAVVYEVAEGDWLSGVAKRFLGNDDRYDDIAKLNPNLERRDARFPDHIEQGWRITLPPGARDRGPAEHARGTVVTAPKPGQQQTPRTGAEPRDPRPGHGTSPAPRTGDATPPSTLSPSAPASTPGSGAPSTAAASPSASATATASPPRPSAQDTRPPAGAGAPTSGSPATKTAPASSSTGTAPAPTDTTTPGAASQPDDDTEEATVIAAALAGAGLLAAFLLTLLFRRRRRQEQHRPVGRRLPTPAQPAVETQLKVVAEPIAVDRLDHALRVLAAGLVDRPAEQMPDIVGVWLEGDTINLLLTAPCPHPPSPWIGDQHNWTLPASVVLPDVEGQLAPLPTLVAVGSQPGMHLMLDLERLGLLTITGDPGRARDLLRYLAVELSCNTWSDHVEVTVAGFDADETGELITLGGDRLSAVPTISAAIERIRRRASQVVKSLEHLNAGDPLSGRIADIAADAWMPHVLLVKDPGPDDLAALQTLDSDLAATGRCAVAVVTTVDTDLGRWPLTIGADRSLGVGFLGMMGPDASLTAAGIPRDELHHLADLLTTARRGTTTAADPHSDLRTAFPPVPPAPETEAWANGTDAAGSLLAAAQDPDADEKDPTDDEAPEDTSSDDELAAASDPATAPRPEERPHTEPAVDEIARIPAVVALPGRQAPARKRPTGPGRRRHNDPTLDADMRAWHDADPTRPRIAILGPVTVEAPGQLPSERLRFYAEIITFLAVRGQRGVTTDQFDEGLWPNQQVKATSRRVAVARARRWLGETVDGDAWLPDATADRRYRLRDGYLLDWHLFRRLRARGEDRGPAGVGDLRQALSLVRGAPLAGADVAYSAAARNPYVWLPTSEIPPHHLAAAVVDTAHHMVDLCLAAADTTGARWAVDQAWLADPDRSSDIAWRDLLRVAAAEGNTAELEQLFGEIMRVRDAEVPEDLDTETYRLLCELLPDRMRAGVR